MRLGCCPANRERYTRGTSISRLAPHVTTPTRMALARQRDYRTTRRYLQVHGDHLRVAVEPLAERSCHLAPALIDSLLDSVKTRREKPEPIHKLESVCSRLRWQTGCRALHEGAGMSKGPQT